MTMSCSAFSSKWRSPSPFRVQQRTEWFLGMQSVFLVSTIGLMVSACGDDNCGPGNAPAVGLVASSTATTLTYGVFTGGLNNDCSQTSTGVISVTIMGTQLDGTGVIAFCIERPDLLANSSQALGPNLQGSPVHPRRQCRASASDQAWVA
jgi:hypothetical protein